MNIRNLRMRKSFLTATLFLLLLVVAVVSIACPQRNVSLTVGGTPDGSASASCGSDCVGIPPWDVTVTATPNDGYVFLEWDCEVGGSCPTGNANLSPRISLAIEENTVITPKFIMSESVTLDVRNSPGGSATADCEPNCDQVPPWMATVTALADSGYEFVGWDCSGSCPSSGSDPSVLITINRDTQITPIFREITTASLNFGATPNGRVTADCEPNCDRVPPWMATVTALAGTGYEFDYWQCSGSCSGSSADATIILTINEDTVITPVFTTVIDDVVTLTINVGEGGEIDSAGQFRDDCDRSQCTYEFLVGSSIHVDADPFDGYTGGRWDSVRGNSFSSASSFDIDIILTQDTTLSVTFEPEIDSAVTCDNSNVRRLDPSVVDGRPVIVYWLNRTDCTTLTISATLKQSRRLLTDPTIHTINQILTRDQLAASDGFYGLISSSDYCGKDTYLEASGLNFVNNQGRLDLPTQWDCS